VVFFLGKRLLAAEVKYHFFVLNSQADIRNPLRYLLITECCFAAYQEWLAPLLIQASPLLIALRN